MKFTTFLCSLIFFGLISGCSSLFKSAEKAFELGQYYEAAQLFHEAFEKDSTLAKSLPANYMLGESYRLSNQINKSMDYYKKAVEGKYKAPNLYYRYAYALKANERYAEAVQYFKIYLKESSTKPKYRKRAEREIKNLPKIDKLLKTNEYVFIENVAALNTAGPEFSPTIVRDQLVFTGSGKGETLYKATGKNFTDIYTYNLKNKNIKSLSPNINLETYHEASATISASGKLMIFARNAANETEGREVDLYLSRFRRNAWSKPIRLSISNSKYWDACPAFAPNGRTIYFASNRPGGYGGLDLYKVQISKKGKLGRVKNLGRKINTEGNDMFPYVSGEGRLHFASDGHPGLGGLDLFEVHIEGDSIAIKNMGKPYNSYADDFGICYRTLKSGYLSSNRVIPESKGDDDIYYFIDKTPSEKTINYRLSGKTYLRKTEDDQVSEAVLEATQVSLVGPDSTVLEAVNSDTEGFFKFSYPLEIGEIYTLKANKAGIVPHEQEFSTIGKGINEDTVQQEVTNVDFETSIYLVQDLFKGKTVGESVDLLILYDYDKSDIRDDAADILNRLVENLKVRAGLKVELGSHTDARGNRRYNQKLSQRRAESAVNYIVQRGIAKERIVAKGYGKNDLLILNAKTEEEHQKNRRTTIKILNQN